MLNGIFRGCQIGLPNQVVTLNSAESANALPPFLLKYTLHILILSLLVSSRFKLVLRPQSAVDCSSWTLVIVLNLPSYTHPNVQVPHLPEHCFTASHNFFFVPFDIYMNGVFTWLANVGIDWILLRLMALL